MPDANDGPQIAGYEQFELIGRGELRMVYRAWQTALKRAVSIEIVRNLLSNHGAAALAQLT